MVEQSAQVIRSCRLWKSEGSRSSQLATAASLFFFFCKLRKNFLLKIEFENVVETRSRFLFSKLKNKGRYVSLSKEDHVIAIDC